MGLDARASFIHAAQLCDARAVQEVAHQAVAPLEQGTRSLAALHRGLEAGDDVEGVALGPCEDHTVAVTAEGTVSCSDARQRVSKSLGALLPVADLGGSVAT